MGEMVVSSTPSEELVALGLGSCIGLALVDRTAGVAGLAHIVLPESHETVDQPGKFADTAVPELIVQLRRAGAVERRIEAAMVGGARMFEMSGGLDIGARNAEAVEAALAHARVPLRAAQTGGSQGRTIKINVGEGLVSVRIAGAAPEILLEARLRRATTSGSAAARPRITTAAASGRTPLASARVGAAR